MYTAVKKPLYKTEAPSHPEEDFIKLLEQLRQQLQHLQPYNE